MMTGRVIPFFIERGIEEQVQLLSRPRLEIVNFIAYIAFAVVNIIGPDITGADQYIYGLAALLFANNARIVNTTCLRIKQTTRCLKDGVYCWFLFANTGTVQVSFVRPRTMLDRGAAFPTCEQPFVLTRIPFIRARPGKSFLLLY